MVPAVSYTHLEKAGEEYLAPFYNDYRFWIQYQTYDVTQLLCPGENVLSVMLGDGWYKGRFSYLDEARVTEIYGDKFLAAAQDVYKRQESGYPGRRI